MYSVKYGKITSIELMGYSSNSMMNGLLPLANTQLRMYILHNIYCILQIPLNA